MTTIHQAAAEATLALDGTSPLTKSLSANGVSANVTASQPMTKRELVLWFSQLKANLAMGLGITSTDDEEDWFIARMIHDGFTRTDADKADLWCMRYKPWGFDGTRPRLSYHDLWPDPVKLTKAIEGTEMVLVKKSDLERLHGRARANDEATVRNAMSNDSATKSDHADTMKLVVKLNSEKMDLWVKNEELESELSTMRRRIDFLTRENERLRSKQNADAIAL